ncbi:HutD family protein [Ideonella sp. DXS22W]|uniref:HutD family protein n=1 Tax=Pseudaquabacterium inlustre TaxID=2984192 RepID=A0ABU9CM86_9BURK
MALTDARGWQWLAVDPVPPEPWRNGGGRTRTLFTWPGGGGADWQLRVSVADIERDGPFSAFDGVRRGFAVLQGAGVQLQFGAQQRRLTVDSEPLHFDGADAPGCTLIGGPTRDLNLMLRGLDGGLLTARPGEAWMPPPGTWAACLCTASSRLHLGEDWLDAPVLGLAIAAPAGVGPCAALRWTPIDPAARACWLWAQLPESPSPTP